MPRKFTAQENIARARSMLAAAGCKYISWTGSYDDYISYECVCGRLAGAGFYNFNRSKCCLACILGKKSATRVKYILAYYVSRGCKVLFADDLVRDYIVDPDPNRQSKSIKFECVCGKIGSKEFSKFYKRPYCRYCSVKISLKKHVLTYERRIREVKVILKKAGCEYMSWTGKLQDAIHYVCRCGGVGLTALDDFQRGMRCRVCSHQERSVNTLNSTYTRLSRLFADYGCRLLTEPQQIKYGWHRGMLWFVCICGNTDRKWLRNFVKHPRCSACTRQEITSTRAGLQSKIFRQLDRVDLPTGLRRISDTNKQELYEYKDEYNN